MDLHCFRCTNSFQSTKEAIRHLRNDHCMVDNCSPMKCLAKNCERTYNTFKGLSNHLDTFNHQSEPNVSTLELCFCNIKLKGCILIILRICFSIALKMLVNYVMP